MNIHQVEMENHISYLIGNLADCGINGLASVIPVLLLFQIFQSPFHYNERGREKFSNENSPHKMTFENQTISDISLHLKYRECRAEERDFLKIGFPNISINSNLSILQKMLTPCLQMQQKT